MLDRRKIPVAVAIGLTSACLYSAAGKAEFNLNWTADTPNPTFSGTSLDRGSVTNAIQGQTPFIYERVLDNGVPYYHMIIGNPTQGFAQEVYIQVGTQAVTQGFGNIGPQLSSSGGQALPPSLTNPNSNAGDPLGTNTTFTGNSTGNPNRVQMRQILEDGDLSADFIKDKYLEKPTIKNNINSSDLSSTFEMDSSGNPYTSSANPSVITNRTELLGPNLPPVSTQFDAVSEAQNPRITAGRYTTTNPSVNNPAGPYTYVEGTANLNPNWKSFFDFREANPWGYTDNRPTPPP